ncbi:acylphosphatase [Rhodopirellula halodulae]|uniref:acylphosphatase n=1 Tax=Rhodopirellula halodulae TaxID=2894198 RepID=UPI001E635095|nr:acylphosphatase [Rhodopirellula sp. JC737]MCC9657038.1 acylphosphatase [Rhodopirellula sp. JC737]
MSTHKQIRKVVRYRGHVQGVGFRANAIHQARGLTIQGFVRNEPDGDVLMDVQGPQEDVLELLKRVANSMERKINDAFIDDRAPLPDREKFSIHP